MSNSFDQGLKLPHRKLKPAMSRPEIDVLTGPAMPVADLAELRRAGAYIILHKTDDHLTAYVGMSGRLVNRLAGRAELRPNSGSVQLITITSEADDLDRADALVLERMIWAALDNCADVTLLNEAPPCHSHLNQERYTQLRVFVGEALCRLAENSLLPFNCPPIDLLAGPEMAFLEMLAPASLRDLNGAERMRLVRRGVTAEALFLQSGAAILKAGSEVREAEIATLHGGISALRHEAVFSGIVVKMREGVLRLVCDLAFESSNAATQFVLASASGMVGHWRPVELKESENTSINREGELLSQWRRKAPPLGDTKLACEIRKLLISVTPIGTKDWDKVARGDLATTVNVAISVTNAVKGGPADRTLDLAMSAIFACAIEEQRGAPEVFESLMIRLAAKGVQIDAPVSFGARP